MPNRFFLVLAQLGQMIKLIFWCLPNLGKCQIDFFGACPTWANDKTDFLALAQLGQMIKQTFRCLPNLGKHFSFILYAVYRVLVGSATDIQRYDGGDDAEHNQAAGRVERYKKSCRHRERRWNPIFSRAGRTFHFRLSVNTMNQTGSGRNTAPGHRLCGRPACKDAPRHGSRP